MLPGMYIVTPSELAGLFTLGAMILAALTALVLCLQRADGQVQPVPVREPDTVRHGADD
jgi:hypothetical protein